MRHEFDAEDVPHHCGSRACKSSQRNVHHVVNYPRLNIALPHPDSLHVRAEPATCGCPCGECLALVSAHESAMPEAVMAAFKAYEAGAPIRDARCLTCQDRGI